MIGGISLDRLRAARDQAALDLLDHPENALIFDRLDREVMAREANDPVARARAIAARVRSAEKGSAA